MNKSIYTKHNDGEVSGLTSNFNLGERDRAREKWRGWWIILGAMERKNGREATYYFTGMLPKETRMDCE
jgi:hypothetical protein